MKVVVLTNAEQKDELTAQGQLDAAEIYWAAEPGGLADAAGADACIDLNFNDTKERITQLQQLQTQIIIINSVINPLNEANDGCVRINGWNTFLKRPVTEAAGDDNLKKKAEEVFSFFNKKMEWVADIAGFVSPRVIASIINEAYFALEEKVSTKEEIDTAMKLGTNYPYGPFEWSEKIGLKNIYALLTRLSAAQKRYEPAALLAKEAFL
jgi:3-hydroxybutyryl-CoA dehydrogenase